MIKNIVILGDHIQSLGVARIAQRLGYPVILFNMDSICLTRFSNSCSRFVKFSDEEDLLQKLLELGSKEKDSLLIPTNDPLIHFVSRYYQSFSKVFSVSLPNPAIVEICYNKKATYLTAERLNVPIPNSLYPSNKEELVGHLGKLRYPVIIKPAIVTTFSKITGKKVFVCKSRDELLRKYDTALEIVPAEEIIVQEIVEGGAKNLFSYCSFIAGGKIYGSFIANRIRQNPMDFGFSTTFAISVTNDNIEQLAERFLKGINYFGLSEVEMMYDPRDKSYKLIEINARTWKWHSIANKLNINLIGMLIAYFDDKIISEKRNRTVGIGWIECVTDTYIAVKEIIGGNMSLNKYLKTLRVKKEFACFSRRDLLPGLCYLFFLPYLFFNR